MAGGLLASGVVTLAKSSRVILIAWWLFSGDILILLLRVRRSFRACVLGRCFGGISRWWYLRGLWSSIGQSRIARHRQGSVGIQVGARRGLKHHSTGGVNEKVDWSREK